jgi:NADH-quinone oxidoreductase subunit E
VKTGEFNVNSSQATLVRNAQSAVQVFPPEELDRLDEIIDRYSAAAEYLIPALKDAQDMFGYLPWEIQHRLARGFHVTPSRVYGVVTFYSFFTTVPRGKHTIRLCLGTACYVKGSKSILESIVSEIGMDVGETSQDGLFTFEAVRCLGACGLAPVLVVGEETYGNMDRQKTMKILRGYQ